MDPMEIRSIPAEFKADVEKRTVEGYGSVFGNIDAYDDVVEKGAFLQTIAEDLPNAGIKYFGLHRVGLGVITDLSEDEKGLYFRARLSATRDADEHLILVRDRVIAQSSIGFRARQVAFKEDEARKIQVRLLQNVKLYEISGVYWGANDKTTAQAKKDLEDLAVRIEKAITGLREVPVNRAVDKPTPADVGLKALSERLARLDNQLRQM